MGASVSTYILSYIKANIPPQLLDLAFTPSKFSTTIDQRIISEIVEGPILLDTNLIGGKRREIIVRNSWKMDIDRAPDWSLGVGLQGAFYQVPAEAREGRNISSVIGVSQSLGAIYPGSNVSINGSEGMGNTANNMLSQMLNTRTFANTPMQPQVTLQGTNILCFYPEMFLDECIVSVMLEFDSEFLNMNQSSIFAMRNLCLCAVQRYIYTNLRVPVDETQVVAGLEIGVIRTLIEDCGERAKEYDSLLRKLKGGLLYDPRSMSRLAYLAL